MKRYIKSNTEKIYYKLTNPSLRSYRFSGILDYDHNSMEGEITKVAPYDDAEYVWAKIAPNMQVKFIQDGKVIDKMQCHYYEPDDYDSVDDYFNDIVESVADELNTMNRKISPVMVHN